MAEKRSGLLLVLMQPPATLEEEFNAWYDTEHVPERAAVPGFRTALRYVCLSGYPRYMAIYDLDSQDVLDSPEYNAVSGENFSPWTKRVTIRVQVTRIVADQIFPGDAMTQRSARLMLIRLRAPASTPDADVVAAARSCLEGLRGTQGLRVFADRSGTDACFYIFAEFSPAPSAPIDLLPLGAFASHVDLVNLYTPYNTAG